MSAQCQHWDRVHAGISGERAAQHSTGAGAIVHLGGKDVTGVGLDGVGGGIRKRGNENGDDDRSCRNLHQCKTVLN